MASTLTQQLKHWATTKPSAPALHRNTGNNWEAISWESYFGTVKMVANSLISIGVNKGDCVVIIGNNRVEWLYAQFGIMAAGAIATPSYQTNTAEQIAYIINHCQARFVFAENKEQYDKLVEVRGQLSQVERVILFDDVDGKDESWAIAFSDLLKLSVPENDSTVDGFIDHSDPDDTFLIIYTSGTTGVPKGVLISHKNASTAKQSLFDRFKFDFLTRVICYLPLSHIAEQATTNILQMESGGEVYMCDDALKMKDYLVEVRPTIMLGVPRVWEKFESALNTIIGEATGLKAKLLKWAFATELAAFDKEQQTGKKVSSFSRNLANKLVISKIKQKLGMDEVVFAFTGAAPCSKDTMRFFASLGIGISEVYGMTETTALISTTAPDNLAFGTVGKPMDSVEVKIADDGEVLARGDGMTKGYLNNPEATAELWEGGWLHTGDVGEFDANGNLKITDRKKDLLITAGAKNVAPQPIEAKLKRIDGVSQAVVVGDKKPYLIALLTLDGLSIETTAGKLGINDSNMSTLSANADFQAFIEQEIEKVNSTLAKFETIKRFKILPADFSVDADELTPTLKVKRKNVNAKYAGLIEEIYTA